MAVRIREEPLSFTRRLDERSVEATASGSLRLPGDLPDVEQVIFWRPFACVDQLQVDPGASRVEARGRARVWVVYTAASPESPDPAGALFGGKLEGDLPWSAWAEVPAGPAEVAWDARVEVRDVSGRFRSDGRTADVDVVLSVVFSGVQRQHVAVVTHASATVPCRVEGVTALLRAGVVQGLQRARVTVGEALALPAAGPGEGRRARILDVQVTPSVTRAELEAGAISVQGTVHYEVLYGVQGQAAASAAPASGEGAQEGDEEALRAGAPEQPPWELGFVGHTAVEPFRASIPVPEAPPDSSVRVAAWASDVVAWVTAGVRAEVRAEIELHTRLTASRPLQVVTEIRDCEQLPVEQRRAVVELDGPPAELRRTFSASTTLELVAGQAPVERVLWAGLRVEPVHTRVEAGRIFVSASATPWIYYTPYRSEPRTGGLLLASWPMAVTIEQALALGETRAQARAQASLVGISVETDLINRQTVEFTVAGTVVVESWQSHQQEVVAEAVALPEPSAEPSPFFYLVVTQPGDTLWKLSRRYGAEPEAIARDNPETAGHDPGVPLPAGRRLFVRRQG